MSISGASDTSLTFVASAAAIYMIADSISVANFLGERRLLGYTELCNHVL